MRYVRSYYALKLFISSLYDNLPASHQTVKMAAMSADGPKLICFCDEFSPNITLTELASPAMAERISAVQNKRICYNYIGRIMITGCKQPKYKRLHSIGIRR